MGSDKLAFFLGIPGGKRSSGMYQSVHANRKSTIKTQSCQGRGEAFVQLPVDVGWCCLPNASPLPIYFHPNHQLVRPSPGAFASLCQRPYPLRWDLRRGLQVHRWWSLLEHHERGVREPFYRVSGSHFHLPAHPICRHGGRRVAIHHLDVSTLAAKNVQGLRYVVGESRNQRNSRVKAEDARLTARQ